MWEKDITVVPGKENAENGIAAIIDKVIKEYLPKLMMDRR